MPRLRHPDWRSAHPGAERSVFDDQPGDAEALPFAGAQPCAVLADQRVVARGRLQMNSWISARCGCRFHLGPGYTPACQAQVLKIDVSKKYGCCETKPICARTSSSGMVRRE